MMRAPGWDEPKDGDAEGVTEMVGVRDGDVEMDGVLDGDVEMDGVRDGDGRSTPD